MHRCQGEIFMLCNMLQVADDVFVKLQLHSVAGMSKLYTWQSSLVFQLPLEVMNTEQEYFSDVNVSKVWSAS